MSPWIDKGLCESVETYVRAHPELLADRGRRAPDLAYNIVEDGTEAKPTAQVVAIGQLSFSQLEIPTYQRPYKWTAKNVNQLISDLIAFREQSHYRLGTLVLRGNEIVDGQQRIITLVLLLRTMMDAVLDDQQRKSFDKVAQELDAFAHRMHFHNRYTLHNVVENICTIESRRADFDVRLLSFLLERCEFVVIRLGSISEAFQFFDSQNARGKDLAAHDLLKAYHLREISHLSERDAANIDLWQNQATSVLREVFLTLFRAKRWSKGKEARRFTKGHIGLFKGISLTNGRRYPFYQMEVIAHIFTEIYNSDPTRIIDAQSLEFPFNLDDQIINGSRFFDMIAHYMRLYETLHRLKDTLPDGRAREILRLVHDYPAASRTGDGYVRSMFYTLLLYYVDRFGMEELDKVVPQFFVWAYTLRLQHPAVQLASVDNHASQWDSLFRTIGDAQTPYDIINLNLPCFPESEIRCTGCERIAQMFATLNKTYRND